MKRLRLRTVEDFDAMPEDEWVEGIGPLSFRWVDEKVHVKGKELIVPLSAPIRRKFKPREGEVLRARVTKRGLVVERKKRAKQRRPSKS